MKKIKKIILDSNSEIQRDCLTSQNKKNFFRESTKNNIEPDFKKNKKFF